MSTLGNSFQLRLTEPHGKMVFRNLIVNVGPNDYSEQSIEFNKLANGK